MLTPSNPQPISINPVPPTPPQPSAKIRNIIQTAQEREIIKTAPDMVVYIDSLPFLNNPYLSQGSTSLVAVNFNDYITAITTSYNINSMIPSGTINLSVPNGSKQLFMAPGGSIIIDIMSAIRIYAKGYFFSAAGNTIFRRIFNGLITSVALNETPTSLEITIGIAGICRLLEMTQIELNKALIGNSDSTFTIMRTNQSDFNIYAAVYDTFHKALDFSEFTHEAYQQNFLASDRDKEAINQEYCTKWTTRLQDLCRDVRLFGWSSNNKAISSPIAESTKVAKHNSPVAAKAGEKPPPLFTQTDMCKENAGISSLLREYAFDMVLSGVKLFGNQLVTRLERIRHLVDIMGFESYQDVDGLIIIKPPLYNLDCTIVSNSNSPALSSSGLSEVNLTPQTNPYIINMSEILSENYQEEESAIRKTSMLIATNFCAPGGFQTIPPTELNKIVRFTDVNLVRKFGVRQEQAKPCGFLYNDLRAAYGFCAAELARANIGFTTYSASIPLRPELRLGFTVYMPHKDMYAYITGIAHSYNVGGQATTSLTCNFVRKRPLFLQPQNITQNINGQDVSQSVQIYAAQPNLVHAFTSSSATQYDSQSGNVLAKAGVISSVPLVATETRSPDQVAVREYLAQIMGSIYETRNDMPVGANISTWRIQNDGGDGAYGLDGTKVPFGNETPPDGTGTWYNGGLDVATGTVFSKAKVADGNYIDRTTMVQPYTNEKGYEVISPFPWGRYATLTDALITFTTDAWPSSATDSSASSSSPANFTVSAFLTAGLTTHLNSSNAATELLANNSTPKVKANLPNGDTLITQDFPIQKFDKTNVPYFELAYSASDMGVTETSFAIPNWSNPNHSASGAASGTLGAASSVPQSSDSSGLQTWSNNVDALQVFLQGFIGPTNSNNVGPYAVSTLTQNTDIGGYAPPNGPLSGVLLSMSATFVSSPYGAILGLRPTGATQNPAYTTGTNATYTGDTLGQTLTNIGNILSGGG